MFGLLLAMVCLFMGLADTTDRYFFFLELLIKLLSLLVSIMKLIY